MANQKNLVHDRLLCVAFTNCSNATTATITASVTASEEFRLRELLRHLQAFGLILPPTFVIADAIGFTHAIDTIASTVGSSVVDAALAARCNRVGGDPAPVAVMPVWPFEPEGPEADVMLSSARLWGVDLLVEALRVDDDESGIPVRAVQDRHARWLAAAGAGRPVRPIRLSGIQGSFAVFAASAPI